MFNSKWRILVDIVVIVDGLRRRYQWLNTLVGVVATSTCSLYTSGFHHGQSLVALDLLDLIISHGFLVKLGR
jgi:hypothetical protein